MIVLHEFISEQCYRPTIGNQVMLYEGNNMVIFSKAINMGMNQRPMIQLEYCFLHLLQCGNQLSLRFIFLTQV